MRLPGPHLPILSRRLRRKHLSPVAFSKKRVRVPKPAKTSEIFLAAGHDLTFPSRAQSLIENICCHTPFEKKRAPAPQLVCTCSFFSPWQGPHFSTLNPKLERDFLSSHPFLKKRKPDPPPGLPNLTFTCDCQGLSFPS